MKAVLEFNLPEDSHEFEMSSNGVKAYCVLSGFDEFLRKKMKYYDLTSEQYEVYEECRNELRDMLSENNITI